MWVVVTVFVFSSLANLTVDALKPGENSDVDLFLGSSRSIAVATTARLHTMSETESCGGLIRHVSSNSRTQGEASTYLKNGCHGLFQSSDPEDNDRMDQTDNGRDNAGGKYSH